MFLPLIKKQPKKMANFWISKPHSSQDIFLWALQSIPRLEEHQWDQRRIQSRHARRHLPPVSTHIIEGLQRRCDEYGVLRRLNDIVAADRIKIERGPFAEFICNVEQINDDQRAWVLIDGLHHQTRADVSLEDVSKIN